jgi:transcriptional regulator with XRE-family HTH domain
VDTTKEVTVWGDVIRRHRDLLDFTRAELAVMIGKSEPLIEKYETGTTRPPIEMARALDEALGSGEAVVAACGYAVADVDWGKEISTLRERISQLATDLQALTAIVSDLQQRGH